MKIEPQRGYTMKKQRWEKAGVVAVDSGVVLVADPCYTLQGKKDTGTICLENSNDVWQLNFPTNRPGRGVVVSSGYGDGCYDVLVRRKGNRISEMRIIFIAD